MFFKVDQGYASFYKVLKYKYIIVASFLFLLWQQRQDGKVCPVKIRAELEARCRLLREGKGAFMQNCSVLAEIAIHSMYSTA